MEREFVGRNFRYIRVSPVYNGVTWTTERMCQQITTAYRAFNRKVDVFVWIDREGRNESAAEIVSAIRNALIAAGAGADEIFVMVNDRMAENVILADEEVIQLEFLAAEYSYQSEGQNGKFKLKELYKAHGVSYRELTHGVQLFKKLRLEKCAEVSPAVATFLGQFDRECWWVRRPE